MVLIAESKQTAYSCPAFAPLPLLALQLACMNNLLPDASSIRITTMVRTYPLESINATSLCLAKPLQGSFRLPTGP